MIPSFSLEERDRRWRLVRQEMRKANLDALIALPNQGHWDQFRAEACYLTQIGGHQTEVAVTMPLEADVTAAFPTSPLPPAFIGEPGRRGVGTVLPVQELVGGFAIMRERTDRAARRSRTSLP